MNQELTQKLCDEFPELYLSRDKPMRERAMCFGFECGDGWFDLIERLSADIMALSTREGIEPPKVVQVKQKFGGLRYYIDGGTWEMNARIEEAEEESITVCEVCGEAARTRRDDWVQTLCNEHYEKQDRRTWKRSC
ncbi:MAG: hypothetical protein Q9M30_00210 [Mariprofundaceae bacterium]|nr:hypothetical protein [Mariprofundaceae bacterium]